MRKKILIVAALASVSVASPALLSAGVGERCAAVEKSVLAAPEWYAGECLEGAAVRDYSAYRASPQLLPGDTAFYKSNFPTPLEIKTAPLPTLTFTTVGANTRTLFAMTFDPAATTLYAVDDDTRELGTVDQTTGAFTVIATLNPDPTGMTVTGMSFDPTTGTAYFTATDGATQNLWTINTTTAALTLVGPTTGFPLIIDIAFDGTGQLYGHDIGGDQLVRIDKATGGVTVVGPTGLAANFAQGMMYDPSDDTLYGCAYVVSPAQQGELVTFNRTTGAATVVAGPVPDELECGIRVSNAPGPTNLVATATAANTVSLAWDAVPAAASYRVYRAVGACPQATYQPIATGVLTNSYDDTTVSGGLTYSYVVTFVDSAGVPSKPSNCDDALATGSCTLPPTFAGVVSVASAGTSACGLDVSWGAATPSCPSTTVSYNVYRSLTPGFTPGPANLRQSCVSALTFLDGTVTGGTPYYYKVRAEDSTANGSGPCNSGNEDLNLIERNGVPSGPVTTETDDVEAGGANWTNAGGSGTNLWAIVTDQSNSPTHSWNVTDPAAVTDQRLATVTARGLVELSFFHRFNTESTYDGYVLEYSLDGTTWVDILAGTGPIPANANRFLQNGYNATISTGFSSPIAGRRAWSGDNLAFQQVRVDMADFAGNPVFVRFRFASDTSVADVGVWIDDIVFSIAGSCGAGESVAAFGLAVDAAGNNVLEPGETAVMAPAWRNTGGSSVALTGAASNFTGPGGPTYNLTDATADYGMIAAGANASCSSTGDCFGVSVTGTRPALHWDATVDETVTPTSTAKTWTLHVGNSFTDVPSSNGFYRFVETLLHKGITGGCGPDTYCPSSSTTREQMAVFVLVAKEGAGYTPPACATPNVFTDVPETSPYCRFIEELSTRGVVGGCGTNLYCPTSPVTREQMAIFVLKTLDPTLVPPPCSPPNLFTDVPETSAFCAWVEELANRGVVTGCGTNLYCPADPVTREQMGVFLTVTFSLALYGV